MFSQTDIPDRPLDPDQAPNFQPAEHFCDKCGEPWGHLIEFDNSELCAPCLSAGRCRFCRQHMSLKGQDECMDCAINRYVADPVEFQQAVELGWLKDAAGRQIVRRVLEQLPAQRMLVMAHYRQFEREARDEA